MSSSVSILDGTIAKERPRVRCVLLSLAALSLIAAPVVAIRRRAADPLVITSMLLFIVTWHPHPIFVRTADRTVQGGTKVMKLVRALGMRWTIVMVCIGGAFIAFAFGAKNLGLYSLLIAPIVGMISTKHGVWGLIPPAQDPE